MSIHLTGRQLIRQIFIKSLPVAFGGTAAALAGTVASIHWEMGTLAEFKTDVSKQFERQWAAIERLLLSHEELRNNMHVINETLKKTQKEAQEQCAALQAARLELVTKGKKLIHELKRKKFTKGSETERRAAEMLLLLIIYYSIC